MINPTMDRIYKGMHDIYKSSGISPSKENTTIMMSLDVYDSLRQEVRLNDNGFYREPGMEFSILGFKVLVDPDFEKDHLVIRAEVVI